MRAVAEAARCPCEVNTNELPVAEHSAERQRRGGQGVLAEAALQERQGRFPSLSEALPVGLFLGRCGAQSLPREPGGGKYWCL